MVGRRDRDRPTPPRVRPGSDPTQSVASLLLILSSLALAIAPGVALGGAAATGWWRLSGSPPSWRWTFAAMASVSTAFLSSGLAWAWPWRLLLGSLHLVHESLGLPDVARSVAIEATAGPAVLLAARYGDELRQESMDAHLRRSYDRDQTRGRALRRDLRKGIGPLAPRSTSPGSMAHPPGKVRLGTEPEQGGRVFDLDINELRQHVFIPGASGTGKTTTVARLADGVLAAGWSVVIVDCKGTGLVSTARELSARYGVPLHIIDPGDPHSSGYNPCTGDGPDIANKLVGAYSFGPNAEIFENISSNVLSVTVDAMRAAGRPVSVDDLIDTIGSAGGLADLADADGLDARARTELRRLDAMRPGSLSRDGMDGMVERLRALASGRFGNVLRTQPAVDLRAATQQPSVVLFALSATGADRDVNLVGRVIAQDVKQLCDARLRANRRLTPVMLVFDEFHKLSDAGQIVDLLLQARQAEISVVLATQVLPKDEVIRKPALQSGVLIVHRLETDDAQVLGAQLGTRAALGFTVAPAQSDEETTRVSLRPIDEFIVHPNVIRRLSRPGLVALRSVTTDRDALLQIYRPQEVSL